MTPEVAAVVVFVAMLAGLLAVLLLDRSGAEDVERPADV